MSNLKLTHTPQSWNQADELLGKRDSMRIGHNTELVRNGNGIFATYHGNKIVNYTRDGVYASWAGWASATTSTRLNMLTAARFNIKQFEPYVNGERVGSTDWTKV